MSEMRDAYKEWILEQPLEDCAIEEAPKGNLIISNELLRGWLNFYDIDDIDIVEFRIERATDGAQEFFLHFELVDLAGAQALFAEMAEVIHTLSHPEAVHVLVCCSAGMTSTYFSLKLNGIAQERGIEYEFSALSIEEAKRDGGKFALVLLAPQVGYLHKQVVEELPGTPVLDIPARIFGTHDAEAALDLVVETLDSIRAEAGAASESADSALAVPDQLTGLMSMDAFYEEVQELLDDDDQAETLVFVHFNILQFKIYNEEHGFKAGDDVLRLLAQTLQNEFSDAKLARSSSDHFVLCTTLELVDVIRRINRVNATMMNGRDDICVEVRAGICLFDGTFDKAEVACDHARYAANTVKRRSDRAYGIYDSILDESHRLRQYVINHVDEAVDSGYLKVYYQPIVRVSTGEICAYEALARWNDPEAGFLPPSSFIGTLEESRSIHKVDCFVAKQVCEDFNALHEAGEPIVPVFVNLSPLDFELCDVFASMEACRALYNVNPEMLIIKVSEGALSNSPSELIDILKQFRRVGYRVCVDDFGSGYSALNSLIDYDFEVLKLGLEFLRTYDESPRAGVLIKNVIQVAHRVNIEPLQGGVERQEHYDFLREIGCEMAQGYFFARPMELAESRAATRAKGIGWELQDRCA